MTWVWNSKHEYLTCLETQATVYAHVARIPVDGESTSFTWAVSSSTPTGGLLCYLVEIVHVSSDEAKRLARAALETIALELHARDFSNLGKG